MDEGPGVVQILLLFVLILLNAFFAMSELAILSLNELKVRKMAEAGNKKAAKILELIEEPSHFLSTIQIGVTLAGFLTSASAASSFSEPLAAQFIKWFPAFSKVENVVYGAAMVVVTVIISYFSLVLGELAPKRIAMQGSERISFAVVGPLLVIKKIMKPFIKVLSASTNGVVRLLGYNPKGGDEALTKEEIRMLVDEGEEKGVIDEDQKEMIHNIFDFTDVPIREVMTHRTEMAAVSEEDSIEAVAAFGCEHGYSRLPVYGEEVDDIRGIVYVKDLLQFVGQPVPPEKTVADMMRQAYFVPETKRCRDLFEEMTEKHLQMVLVSDEYGMVSGLVTIEDLLEHIVGDIQDEYDDEEAEIVSLGENSYEFDGGLDVKEVEELLHIKLPEGEYDTAGGFVMDVLGRVPTEGEPVEVESSGYRFVVTQMKERRICRVRAERMEASTEDMACTRNESASE